jgi:ATP-dependent DNA helicase RecQ
MKHKIYHLYAHSKNLDLIQRIIKAYEQSHPKKFKSTWNTFLKEARVEDFYHPEKNIILVSTMHKSKGKEFDNVFILLNNYPLQTEARKRVLYVAMTRAKENLYIHTNNINFPISGIAALSHSFDKQQYNAPETLIIECTMKDVWLGYFKRPPIVENVKTLTSGAILLEHKYDLAILQDSNGKSILKFSKYFQAKLNRYKANGYQLINAFAKYIIAWYDEETGLTYRVVLPELVLRKKEFNA